MNTLMDKATARSQEKREVQKEDEHELYGEDEYTEEALFTAWDKFAEQSKAANKDSEYAILKQKKRLEDNHTIIITFTSILKQEILKNFRAELVDFLKKSVNNRHLQLVEEVTTIEGEQVPYTNSEKFQYLAKKNPKLAELQQRLGLDPDF